MEKLNKSTPNISSVRLGTSFAMKRAAASIDAREVRGRNRVLHPYARWVLLQYALGKLFATNVCESAWALKDQARVLGIETLVQNFSQNRLQN